MKNKVLLIGSSGFIGRHLINGLEDQYEIFQINRSANSNYSPDQYLSVDLLKAESAEQIREWSMDKSFNSAIYLTNINNRNVPENMSIGEANLLALARFLENFSGTLEKIGFFSSVYVYKNPDDLTRIMEDSDLEPTSSYSLQKIEMEEQISKWCSVRNIFLSIFRSEWVFGEGDITKKLIPELCKAAISSTPYIVKINPLEIRQPIYISDVVCAITHWLETLPGQPVEVNLLVGPVAISQKDLWEIARKISFLPENLIPEFAENSTPYLKYSFDDSITRSRLNWKPEIQPEEGLHQILSRSRKPIKSQESKPWFFFDLDGTLLDIRKKFYALHCDCLSELGVEPLSRDKYWSLKQNGTKEEEILRLLNQTELHPLYNSHRIERIEDEKYLALDEVWPGIEEELLELKFKANIAIVTLRRNRTNLHNQLKNTGLDIIFENIFNPNMDQFYQSGSETKVNLVRKAFNRRMFTGWFIGDTEVDILAGKTLGMKTCAVGFGLRKQEILKLLHPDESIDTPEEFLGFIKVLSKNIDK